jgi:hypothetical protein
LVPAVHQIRWDEKCTQNINRVPEGKRELWKFERRQKASIKIDLENVVCEGEDWIQLLSMGSKAGCCEHCSGSYPANLLSASQGLHIM